MSRERKVLMRLQSSDKRRCRKSHLTSQSFLHCPETSSCLTLLFFFHRAGAGPRLQFHEDSYRQFRSYLWSQRTFCVVLSQIRFQVLIADKRCHRTLCTATALTDRTATDTNDPKTKPTQFHALRCSASAGVSHQLILNVLQVEAQTLGCSRTTLTLHAVSTA